MSRFSRLKTLDTIIKIGIIPVFFNYDVEVAKRIISACAEGGALCIEMTNRGDGAINIFRELEEFCTTDYPEVILGAGSIIDSPTAASYINNGANFIVGPLLDEETAILCNKRKIPYCPGCATASEIHKALSLGVEICKVFPGDLVGGPSFVEAIKGPCPWVSLMPTGGVEPTRESLYKWFKSGIVCCGIGSKLITKEIVKNRNFDKLTKDVKEVIRIIKEIKMG